LFASDALLTQGTIGYGQSRGPTEWNLSYAHNTFDLEYRPAPFDFLGYDTSVSENRNTLQVSFKQRLFAPLTLLAAGGFYDGFTDYRSPWLNEYYRQQFSALPEYEKAHPGGQNVSASLRWEYVPATGFLQVDVGFLEDQIAPGYEIDFDGLRRGRPNLYTSTYRVTTENILTRRVRWLNEFRLTDTTNREKRFGYQGSANLAIGEHWVVARKEDTLGKLRNCRLSISAEQWNTKRRPRVCSACRGVFIAIREKSRTHFSPMPRREWKLTRSASASVTCGSGPR
jgi:hypothetical protein